MAGMKTTLTVDGWRCERCGHEWIPRKEAEPTVCPKCKNPYWNRPRKNKSGLVKESGRKSK